jgi:hypothetical protein
MDSSLSTSDGGYSPPFSHKTTREILQYTRIISPIVLLLVFLIAFVAQSIIAAKGSTNHNNGVRTGPGGRPLPRRSRSTAVVKKAPVDFSSNLKLVFKWLSVAVPVTFVADAAFTMVHVIVNRHENWWCGQSVVVRILTPVTQLHSCTLVL